MGEVFKDHRVGEVFNVRQSDVLSNEDLLKTHTRSLAQRLKLTVVSEHVHTFPPRQGEESGGISLILVIAESHLAIHTWERERRLHIDVFTCSPNTNMRYFRRELTKEFPGEKTKTKKIKY